MKSDLGIFLKGLGMGAANVIPGVSGGTIALITGIYERLINAIKAWGPHSLNTLRTQGLATFWRQVDGRFTVALLLGVAVSIITLARVFEYLLEFYERYTMAFFFGLILLSIFYVGKRVGHWTPSVIIALCLGTATAVSLALLAPASENSSFVYVFICGIAAISSMILPGLSGSFVLIIMGNYSLVLGAINSASLDILVPLALGCGFGLIAFSHVLSWVFKHYKDHTLALMTGFVLGSLVVIWPWKNTLTNHIERPGKDPKEVVTGYEWFLPSGAGIETITCIVLMLLGGLSIVWMERTTSGDKHTEV
ncbi:MAG: DUF368 domain-containing protein [Gammaproteobacteria bacterium]|nr:DUF368 domain-containing protein [Gammaproteobacteria bacterium]